LENLPKQSPDLNPIENLWHDIKMKLRNKHHGNLKEL
jgi:transposase